MTGTVARPELLADGRRLEAARLVVAGVLAGTSGTASDEALQSLGWDEFEPWELTAAAMSLVAGLLESYALLAGVDRDTAGARWALALAGAEVR